MKIDLLAAGTRPPEWLAEGFREYQKRLPRDWRLTLHEIPISRRTKSASVIRFKQEEADKLLSLVKPDARVVALDSSGEIWSTEQLAGRIETWRAQHGSLQLMIGGPDGLDQRCLSSATDVWSLSRLTFPHFMVRVLVAEQLYRVWSVLNNHPYHK